MKPYFFFFLFNVFKRIIALLISPLCIISLSLGFILCFIVMLFDLFLFVFSGKFKLLDYYIDNVYPSICFGWFVEFINYLKL